MFTWHIYTFMLVLFEWHLDFDAFILITLSILRIWNKNESISSLWQYKSLSKIMYLANVYPVKHLCLIVQLCELGHCDMELWAVKCIREYPAAKMLFPQQKHKYALKINETYMPARWYLSTLFDEDLLFHVISNCSGFFCHCVQPYRLHTRNVTDIVMNERVLCVYS